MNHSMKEKPVKCTWRPELYSVLARCTSKRISELHRLFTRKGYNKKADKMIKNHKDYVSYVIMSK